MVEKDWYAWQGDYDVPGSVIALRLTAVQERIAAALDGFPAGPVTVLSLCAGQGRDLLGVLAGHPRRDGVTARLVELDPRNAEFARRTAADAGLAAPGGRGRSSRVPGSSPSPAESGTGLYRVDLGEAEAGGGADLPYGDDVETGRLLGRVHPHPAGLGRPAGVGGVVADLAEQQVGACPPLRGQADRSRRTADPLGGAADLGTRRAGPEGG